MATAEQSPPRELGLAEAADQFAAMMDAPAAQPDPVKRKAAPAEVEETEATAFDADETFSEDDTGSDQESSEDEAADDVEGSEDDQEADSDDRLVTVKIDGKAMQIPLKEALAGYQRNADYSRKTTALAEERRMLESEKQGTAQVRDYASQLANQYAQQLQQLVPQEPDWQELHRQDPINYSLIRDQWRDYKEQITLAQNQASQLEEHRRVELINQKRMLVEEGRKYLLEKVPELKDEKKWAETTKNLQQYGKKAGYTDAELSELFDPRAFIVLDKARKYDALMANRPQPQKQNGPKPIRGGNAASSPQRSNDVTRMEQRLKASGNIKDAAALFGLLDSRRK